MVISCMFSSYVDAKIYEQRLPGMSTYLQNETVSSVSWNGRCFTATGRPADEHEVRRVARFES